MTVITPNHITSHTEIRKPLHKYVLSGTLSLGLAGSGTNKLSSLCSKP